MRRAYSPPQPDKLNALFNLGELSKFLATEFRGEARYTHTRKDADATVVFLSEDRTPKIQSIAEKVGVFFEGQGFCLEPKIDERAESYQAYVYVEGERQNAIFIDITTHYPHEPGSHAALRLVSNAFGPRSPLPPY